MRQPVVAQSEVESQARSDSPIVIAVDSVIVVNPVFPGEKLQLGKAVGVAQQEIHIGVPRIRAWPEDGSSLRVGLQLLVLDRDRKSTRLNSSHTVISYAVFC